MEFSSPLSFMKVNFSKTKLCKLEGNKVYTDVDNALVARIYLKNIRHCELHFISNDSKNTYSYMSVYKKTPVAFQESGNSIYNVKNLFVCQHCNRPIVKIFDDTLENFSLYVVCECGIIYDNKRVPREDI